MVNCVMQFENKSRYVIVLDYVRGIFDVIILILTWKINSRNSIK